MNDNASPLAEEANAYYEDLLRPIFAGRKFLMAGQIAAAVGFSGLARRLSGLGAELPFLIAASEGTGTLPTPQQAELRVLGIQTRTCSKIFASYVERSRTCPPICVGTSTRGILRALRASSSRARWPSRGERVDWELVADYSSIRGAGEIPALLPRPARECGLSCIWSRDDVHRLPRRVWPHRPIHRPR